MIIATAAIMATAAIVAPSATAAPAPIDVSNSVVLVATQQAHGSAKTGTGFVIASTEHTSDILTADHVVADGTAWFVFIGGPEGARYTATVLRRDPLRDIALVEIPAGRLPALQLADPATPVSGTRVVAAGYPTTKAPAPSPAPDQTQAPEVALPLSQLTLTTAAGSVDGETEEGESLLLNVRVSHGDSGAPVMDATTGRIVAMVLGLAAGYGTSQWMSGDTLGLSVFALDAFLQPIAPEAKPSPPSFVITMVQAHDPDVAASWAQLGASAGFIPVAAVQTPACTDASRAAVANAVMEQSGDAHDLSIDLADCSGATLYHDDMTSDRGGVSNLIRLIDRTFLGFIDTHRPEWSTLLTSGVAVDARTDPYTALMSVERNPFGQLIVGHTFRGGPADVAGLEPGDAILKIDGRKTYGLGDRFIARLLNRPEVTLLIDRMQHEREIRVRPQRLSDLTAHGPVPR